MCRVCWGMYEVCVGYVGVFVGYVQGMLGVCIGAVEKSWGHKSGGRGEGGIWGAEIVFLIIFFSYK